jgi:hypothetical protein
MPGRYVCVAEMEFKSWNLIWSRLRFEDADFENLVIHVRWSIVMMVSGAAKSEASAKDAPLDAALAESLLKLRISGLYNRPTDWVFA